MPQIPSQVDIANIMRSTAESHKINDRSKAGIASWALWKFMASYAKKQEEILKPEFGADRSKTVVFNEYGIVVTAQEKSRSGSVDMSKLATLVVTHKGRMTVEKFNELAEQSRKPATVYVETSVVIPGDSASK